MSKEMREQIDRVKNWKQLLNEQQTTTPKVLTLNSHQFAQLVMNTNYSDGYFKDDTIEDRIEFFNITKIPDTPASFENAYFIVLLIGDKIIGIAKVDYYSKPTSIINFFSIDKEYRGCGYSRLMVDALFNEAKNRNKNITTSLYTQLGKTHLQHLFNEYTKKHGVKFIDRKESDPLYQY
jgi:ribosomal protein S18 acetylase RimI-like enzyme